MKKEKVMLHLLLKNKKTFPVLIFLLFFYIFNSETSFSFDNKRFELLSGRKTGEEVKKSWDKRFSNETYLFGKEPAETIKRYVKKLPRRKLKILDLAMGEGRNAVYLAKFGHEVTGIDISSVAIKKSNKLAKENNVKIKGIVGDLNKYLFNENEFDVVLCYYYLDRKLIKKIKNWVKPGGYVAFEAHTVLDKIESKGNKDYLLKENELINLFSGFRFLHFEEPENGERKYSSLLAKKPID